MSSSASRCRLCGGALREVLDLGVLPLVNSFPREGRGADDPRFPLVLATCATCAHWQLRDALPPATLFPPTYPFRVGASAGWHTHAARLAAEVTQSRDVVWEIGSNDGTLLRACLAHGASWGLGIDPAAASPDLPTEERPWGFESAGALLDFYPRPDLILATNVLAHIPDPHAVFAGCARVLTRDGRVVVETPWVEAMLVRGDYATIYHEHLHYWSLGALDRVATQYGLQVQQVTYPEVHGGSLRVVFTRQGHGPEIGMARPELHVRDLKGAVVSFGVAREEAEMSVHDLRPPAYGFCASARGVVRLHYERGLADRLHGVFDDTPEKQGCRMAGTDLRVLPPGDMAGVGSLVVLSEPWHAQVQARYPGLVA